MKQKVAIAMSGGVDSAVAALFLKEEGYDVVGITMRLWDEKMSFGGIKSCCNPEGIADAHQVCLMLDIPHYVINFSKVLEKKVIEPFINDYLNGKTPNPCINCNKYIKFESLRKRIEKIGATYLALGHYVLIKYDKNKKRYLVYKGKDEAKDQSYLFWTANQDQLAHIITPLGKLDKESTRRLAAKKGLPVSGKIESQEICFIPENNYRNFLKRRIGHAIKEGEIINKNGEVIGRHQGIPYYTIGQRKGLGISFSYPLYVIAIDTEKNTIIVGKEEDLLRNELTASNVNFIPFEKLENEIKVEAKIRYKASLTRARVIPLNKNRVKVEFEKPQKAITAGQSVVFYEGDLLLGGGIID